MTWGLALLGALLSLSAFFTLWKRNLNTAAFLAMLDKLTRAGNFDRARKLCGAFGKEPPVATIAAAGLALRLPRVTFRDEAASFRQAPEQLSFEQRSRQALAPLAEEGLAHARRATYLACVGMLLAAVSLLPPWPTAPTVAGSAGVVLGLLTLRSYFSIRHGILTTLQRLPAMLLPEDEMHLVEGEHAPALTQPAAPPPHEPAEPSRPSETADDPAVPATTSATAFDTAQPFPELPPLPQTTAPDKTVIDPVLDSALAREDWARASDHLHRLAGPSVTEPDTVRIELHLRRGDLLDRKLGDLEAACDAFRMALELNPSCPYALARLAQLHHRSEHYEELAEILRRWSETSSDASEMVTLLLHLARLQQERLDKPESARDALLHALLLEPDHQVAQAALTALGE